MEETNLLDIIENKMPTLSKGQKRIANFLTEHYDEAVYLTASRLGEIAGVSESTVVRFAIELGYDGYPKLQYALEELVKTKLTASQRIKVSSERMTKSKKHILTTILGGDSERIQATLANTDVEVFDACVDKILNGKKIYIAAGRSSACLSSFLAFYLNYMLDNVILVTDSSFSELFEQIYRVGSNDVFIGISFPRYSQRTIKAMEYAQGKKAVTIAITDSEQSPLAKNATYFLTARSDMVSFIDSLVAPLSLINALLAAISVKKSKELVNTLDGLERLWNEYQVYSSSTHGKYI